MSLALTDRPAHTAAPETTPRPLVIDPVLDAPPAPPDRASPEAGSEAAAYWEKVEARGRRRRWAWRAVLAVPVVAAAVLATPGQDRQTQLPAPGGHIAAKAPSTAASYGAASAPHSGCSPLWILEPTAAGSCLLPGVSSGRPLP